MAFHLGPAGEENLRSLSEAVIGHWTRVGLLVSKKETGGVGGDVKSSKRTPGFALFPAIAQAVLDGPLECRGG